MNRMRRPTFLAALLLSVTPTIAAAAEAPCLTTSEFASLAGYTLPSIIKGTSQRCASTLGPNAFLRTNGQELANRYATHKAANWPEAKAAFLKLSSNSSSNANEIFSDMQDESLRPIVDAMLEGMISQQIPLDRCATIDKIVNLLSPLPAENTAELVALAVELSSNSKPAQVDKINLCPAEK